MLSKNSLLSSNGDESSIGLPNSNLGAIFESGFISTSHKTGPSVSRTLLISSLSSL